MRKIIWLAVAAGFTSTLAGQPASPSDIDKALELLRQTRTPSANRTNAVAATNRPPANAAPVTQPAAPAASPATQPVPAARPAPQAATAAGDGTLPADVEQRAREMLRRAVEANRTALPAPLSSAPAAPVAQPAPVLRAPNATSAAAPQPQSASPTPTPSQSAAPPPAPSAPRPSAAPVSQPALPTASTPAPAVRAEPTVASPTATAERPSPAQPSALTPEAERKARQLIDEVLSRMQPQETVTPQPVQAARPTQPTEGAQAAPLPAAAEPPRLAPASAATPPVTAPRPAATQIAPQVAPAATAPVQPSTPGVRPEPVAQPLPSTASHGGMTPEQEMRARELIERAWQELDPSAARTHSTVGEGKFQSTEGRERQQIIRDLERDAHAVAQTKPEPSKGSTAGATPSGNVIAPNAQPPSNVSGAARSKQQRLADLLEAYRQDLIGPAEYHKQRAKILSER